MTENFIFKALFISLAAHTALLCVTYLAGSMTRIIRPSVRIGLKSVTSQCTIRAVDIREYPIRPAQQLDLSNNQKLFSDGTIPVSLVKERPMLPFGMFYERKPEHMRNHGVKP